MAMYVEKYQQGIEEQKITGTVVCANRTEAKFYNTNFFFKGNYGGIIATNKTTINAVFSSKSAQDDYYNFSHNIGTIIIASSDSLIYFEGINIKFMNNSMNRNISTGMLYL